jgi:hypothetical protein
MSDYLEECLNKYRLIQGTPTIKKVDSPHKVIDPHAYQDAASNKPGKLSSVAASLVMSIAYAARMARPDLVYTVNELSCHLTKWTSISDSKLHHLYCYIGATRNLFLTGVVELGSAAQWKLEFYTDSNLGGSDLHTRSTSGAALWITAGAESWTRFPLQWSSKRQTSTATSTAESEITSLGVGCRSVLLPAETLADEILGRTTQVEVLQDNAAALQVVASGYSTAPRFLSKHQRLSISFCHEVMSAAHRSIRHCSTAFQRADPLTKGLAGPAMGLALRNLGIFPSDKLDTDFFRAVQGSDKIVFKDVAEGDEFC